MPAPPLVAREDRRHLDPAHGAQLRHLVFEAPGDLVGGRPFFASRAPADHPPTCHPGGLRVLVGTVLGGAVGSKIVFWLQLPGRACGHLPDLRPLVAGKTSVGGLTGGLAGIELAKARIDLGDSTGDLFVVPLVTGTILGRLGRLFAGLADDSYGNPTTLPWGIHFGDGVPPTRPPSTRSPPWRPPDGSSPTGRDPATPSVSTSSPIRSSASPSSPSSRRTAA